MSLRDELIQVAAVAVAIVEDLDGGITKYDRMATGMVLGEIAGERENQEVKWGQQHHGLGDWMTILGEEYGEACQAALDEVIFPKDQVPSPGDTVQWSTPAHTGASGVLTEDT
jgi:hypothetical protein